MRLRASTKIALGFVLAGAAAYGLTKGYTAFRLQGVVLNPIEPSKFCLLAVRPNASVTIIVANHMAQIVEVNGSLENSGSSDGGAESGSIKKRIPVKELLGILRGDSESVAPFLEQMRATGDEDRAGDAAPVWTVDDIEKAVAGDATLRKKLEFDTNCTLEGKPLSTLNLTAFYDGIKIKIPVTLMVKNTTGDTVQGFDIVSFRPQFMAQFYKSMQEKFYDKQRLEQYYLQFVAEKAGGTRNLGTALKSIVEGAKKSTELEKVQNIAGNCSIIANLSMIESGEMEEELGEDAQSQDATFNLKLKLQGAGPDRLWKYSAEGGRNLLVVSDDVAIASASLGSQLNGKELVIKQIADKRLVSQAVDILRAR